MDICGSGVPLDLVPMRRQSRESRSRCPLSEPRAGIDLVWLPLRADLVRPTEVYKALAARVTPRPVQAPHRSDPRSWARFPRAARPFPRCRPVPRKAHHPGE
jgi:hypothetical protein